MRHFDLQHTFVGLCAVAENLEDQPRPVEEFDIPRLFQIALLDRADVAVDQTQVDDLLASLGF